MLDQTVEVESPPSGRAAGTPSLLDNPEHCPGAYSLHLYCKYQNRAHAYDEFPHEPDQVQTFAQALRQARRWGWVYHKDDTATCPKCAKALGLGKFRSPARKFAAAPGPSVPIASVGLTELREMARAKSPMIQVFDEARPAPDASPGPGDAHV